MKPLPTLRFKPVSALLNAGKSLRKTLLAVAALVVTAGSAHAQLDTITITGRVYNDGNGLNNGLIDGPSMSTIGSQHLYIYLIDNRDSVVSRAQVQDDGTYTILAIANRSYNLTLSSANVSTPVRYPTLGIPNAWVYTGEGEIYSTTPLSGDGSPDGGVAINSGRNMIINYGLDERPQGNAYSVTVDRRDAMNRNYVPAAAFSGFDSEDGVYADGLQGREIDLFQANGGILYYNGVAVTSASASQGTRISNFDTAKVRFMLLPWMPHNFAYSIVDDASAPELVPNVVTLAVALPVEMTSFTGRRQNGVNILDWATASERVNSGFVLERSTDGGNFVEVGTIASKALYGSTNTPNYYSFRDNTAGESPVYFYRIRQTDYDGTVAYSKVVKLTAASTGNGPVNNAPLSTYPNPSTGALTLDWNTGADKYTLAIRNNVGTVVMYRDIPANGGVLHSTLDLSNLPAGNYVISLRAGDMQQTHQITLLTR